MKINPAFGKEGVSYRNIFYALCNSIIVISGRIPILPG